MVNVGCKGTCSSSHDSWTREIEQLPLPSKLGLFSLLTDKQLAARLAKLGIKTKPNFKSNDSNDSNDGNDDVVEKILKKRKVTECLVKWAGYDEPTWELESNINKPNDSDDEDYEPPKKKTSTVLITTK